MHKESWFRLSASGNTQQDNCKMEGCRKVDIQSQLIELSYKLYVFTTKLSSDKKVNHHSLILEELRSTKRTFENGRRYSDYLTHFVIQDRTCEHNASWKFHCTSVPATLSRLDVIKTLANAPSHSVWPRCHRLRPMKHHPVKTSSLTGSISKSVAASAVLQRRKRQ